MSGSRHHHDPGDDAPIVPVQFTGAAGAGGEDDPARAVALRRTLVVAAAVVLFIAALSVIFVLPRYVNPDPAAVSAAAKAQPAGSTEPLPSSPIAVEPADAEAAAELRRSNQAQLEKLLDLTARLEQRNVTAWAEQEFAAARNLVGEGEQAYREQRYAAANHIYDDAMTALRTLDERTGEVVERAIEEGFAQIDLRDAAAAEKAFRLALAVSPDNERAQQGLARAGTLDQVLALINEAAGYEDLNDTDAALKRYHEALALDAEAPGASAAVQRIEQQKLDDQFRRIMSEGLDAVAGNKLDEARKSFERALKLKPGSAEARDALKQTENRLLADRIAAHLHAAATAQRDEQWAEAASRYRQAHKLDPQLDGAAASAALADRRAQLDRQIEQVLAEPHRLADDGVHTEALAVLGAARKTADPGPRLSGQIGRLETTITRARTPVPVTVISDNQTEVTLYRVGKLGRFSQRSVSIIPGRYVAVGKRDGFRDVRVEFQVSPAQADAMITVRCEQKLAFGS